MSRSRPTLPPKRKTCIIVKLPDCKAAAEHVHRHRHRHRLQHPAPGTRHPAPGTRHRTGTTARRKYRTRAGSLQALPEAAYRTRATSLHGLPDTAYRTRATSLHGLPDTAYRTRASSLHGLPDTAYRTRATSLQALPDTAYRTRATSLHGLPDTAYRTRATSLQALPEVAPYARRAQRAPEFDHPLAHSERDTGTSHAATTNTQIPSKLTIPRPPLGPRTRRRPDHHNGETRGARMWAQLATGSNSGGKHRAARPRPVARRRPPRTGLRLGFLSKAPDGRQWDTLARAADRGHPPGRGRPRGVQAYDLAV
jgi:hypothetical protein